MPKLAQLRELLINLLAEPPIFSAKFSVTTWDVAMFHVTTINAPPTKGATINPPPTKGAAFGRPSVGSFAGVYLLLAHEMLTNVSTLQQKN